MLIIKSFELRKMKLVNLLKLLITSGCILECVKMLPLTSY